MRKTNTGDKTPAAVLIIVVTVFLLTLGDAAIKGFSAEVHLWQIFVLRSLLALPVLFLTLRIAFPAVRILPQKPGWVILRSLMLTFMWVAYYTSLPHLDLSVAAAAYYTLPIFITLFSSALTDEPIAISGWAAIFLGFAGVVMILRPASDNFTAYAALPLFAAVLYALAMILTRTKCREEHPLILSASLNVSFVLTGLAAMLVLTYWGGSSLSGSFLSPEWRSLTPISALALGLMTIAILIGSIGTAIAYQIGRSSVIATFDFSYVGFATLWGIVFFAERPDILTLGGMLLILVSGMIAILK